MAQRIKLGDVLVVHTPALKNGVDTGQFETHIMNEVLPAWGAFDDEIDAHLFRADRASSTSPTQVGSYWVLWNFQTKAERNRLVAADQNSAFAKNVIDGVGNAGRIASRYLESEGSYTDYELVAPDVLTDRPEVALLGAHFIEVKEELQDEFDAFVGEKLQAALYNQERMPGLDLIYYKAVRGPNKGQYLTLFALESDEARARYWPTDSSETSILMDAFAPLRSIAEQLEPFLVEDSYLKFESGAAASIFESLNWTDFAFLK